MDTVSISTPDPAHRIVPDPEYERFERDFERLSGMRLSLYKEKQMKRRINTLIERKRLDGYQSFLRLLKSDPAELADFIDYTTINVTEFFRTPEHWSAFERELSSRVIPGARKPLRIWSCACSTGEEPYSLAISFLKNIPASDFRIIATDIDDKVLRRAESGVYDEKTILQLSDDIRDRYFVHIGGKWKVSEQLRSCVEFRKLDLLQDPYPTECDLIVCRNILIYFTDEAKDQIYHRFWHSMTNTGCLFLGNAEQIVYYKKFGFRKIRSFLYSKE